MSTMKTVNAFLNKYDLFSISPREDINDSPEYYFRLSLCDCCNGSAMVLASSGARNSDHEILDFEICNDCLAYAANGDDNE